MALLRALVVALFAAWTAAAAADRLIDGVPIPDGTRINAPAAGSLATHARFSGAWAGSWGGQTRHLLIVESIAAEGRATVIYAWGDNPRIGIRAGWSRHPARIEGDVLTISEGFKATYRLPIDRVAFARFERGSDRAAATLTRIDLATVKPGGVNWGLVTETMLPTALSEGGKPVRLQTFVFTPPGQGPFPLALINHGSTGRGTDPKLFKQPQYNAVLGQYLVAHGYKVAFVQRRGRGQSDGLYDEGFVYDRSAYACTFALSRPGADRALTDIDAAIDALRKAPDVKPGPILIGGISRGGILSVAYSGRRPDQVGGILNFVGGWSGEGCSDAMALNDQIFALGKSFPRGGLWLYGTKDSYYSLPFTRARFAAFQRAGGKGQFIDYTVPQGDGHALQWWPELWARDVERYLASEAVRR